MNDGAIGLLASASEYWSTFVHLCETFALPIVRPLSKNNNLFHINQYLIGLKNKTLTLSHCLMIILPYVHCCEAKALVVWLHRYPAEIPFAW